ncbi:hypothetical protein C922_05517 [Plasmodium inui San Antonio 1]|uniref:Uncharacterized protein n=1 Tax=Plasmodium inui San Antonio 1 TaxID=1237626 RepID=W6ZXW5_9APIC|nr:hypothetical protein C922_05517 [Plasmodium inui San Antonio 1]EUD64105.1 hypothetical protein C922_05517 [Plasmodium inui San Antonio 1]
MPIRFSKWIEEVLWRKAGKEPKTEAGKVNIRLSELTGKSATHSGKIEEDRWHNPLELGLTRLSGLRLRSILMCQSLELWINNLVETEQDHWSPDKSSCKVEGVGFLFNGLPRSECKPTEENNQWSALTRSNELWRGQKYQATLATCMDMLSIILNLYQNIETSEEGWQIKSEDACQAIYNYLKEWGGEDVADEVMKEWFYNREQEDMREAGLPVFQHGKSRSSLWEPFFKTARSYVTELQCDRKQGDKNKWEVSCLRTVNNNDCENLGEVGEDKLGTEQVENFNKVRTQQQRSKEAKVGGLVFLENTTSESLSLRGETTVSGGRRVSCFSVNVNSIMTIMTRTNDTYHSNTPAIKDKQQHENQAEKHLYELQRVENLVKAQLAAQDGGGLEKIIGGVTAVVLGVSAMIGSYRVMRKRSRRGNPRGVKSDPMIGYAKIRGPDNQ